MDGEEGRRTVRRGGMDSEEGKTDGEEGRDG